jgi:hypothetical protein
LGCANNGILDVIANDKKITITPARYIKYFIDLTCSLLFILYFYYYRYFTNSKVNIIGKFDKRGYNI